MSSSAAPSPPAAPITPRAIIAGHGGFANGMISAVAQISGLGGVFIPVSNTGLSAAGVEDLLRAAVRDSGARIIFTDLPSGSCTLAARRVARTEPGLVVVTGVALPTVLSFACGSDLATATQRGRDAITVVEGADGA